MRRASTFHFISAVIFIFLFFCSTSSPFIFPAATVESETATQQRKRSAVQLKNTAVRCRTRTQKKVVRHREKLGTTPRFSYLKKKLKLLADNSNLGCIENFLG